MTLGGAWEKTVRASPRAQALVEARSQKIWSRADLAGLARDWAADHGSAVSGRRVSFCLENGPEWFRIFLGIVLCRGVAIPLDSTEPRENRRTLSEHVGAEYFWDGESLVPIPQKRRVPARGTCLVKVTSGSTGRPRALAFSGAQMLADGRQVCAGMCIRKTDTNFALIPLGHSYGLGNLVIPLLANGIKIICGSSPWPQVVAEEVARWQPTVFPAVPPLLRALVASEIPATSLASLRTVISAGAPLEPALAAEFRAKFGKQIHNFYGSSETGGIAFAASDSQQSGGVGRLLPGVRYQSLRGQRFEIASAAVFTRGNPQRRGRFGAHRPADRGWRTDSDELILGSRVGRIIKLAGKRLDLSEVETAIAQIPSVESARVFFHDHPHEFLAAAVVTNLSSRELRDSLRPRLPSWKIPRALVVMAQFPVTDRGKIDRAAVEKIVWAKSSPASSAPAA